MFNKYEIAIIAPSYEADLEDAKIGPKDKWDAAPATPPVNVPTVDGKT